MTDVKGHVKGIQYTDFLIDLFVIDYIKESDMFRTKEITI